MKSNRPIARTRAAQRTAGSQQRVVSRRRAEDRAIEALIALVLFPDPTPPTDEEIEKFIKEFDEGKHQLTPEDEDALARSRPRFMEMLKASTRKPANGELSDRTPKTNNDRTAT